MTLPIELNLVIGAGGRHIPEAVDPPVLPRRHVIRPLDASCWGRLGTNRMDPLLRHAVHEDLEGFAPGLAQGNPSNIGTVVLLNHIIDLAPCTPSADDRQLHIILSAVKSVGHVFNDFAMKNWTLIAPAAYTIVCKLIPEQRTLMMLFGSVCGDGCTAFPAHVSQTLGTNADDKIKHGRVVARLSSRPSYALDINVGPGVGTAEAEG
mmetsp:Transcript_115524/g.246875  ORF Transcript_115524/g.246875 Transcript_115524/m.246875 type:complete len:207 (+) Transcript_115524:1218-1838(+)